MPTETPTRPLDAALVALGLLAWLFGSGTYPVYPCTDFDRWKYQTTRLTLLCEPAAPRTDELDVGAHGHCFIHETQEMLDAN